MKTLRLLSFPIITASILLLASCGGGEAPQEKTYNYEKADSLPSGYLEELGVVKTNIEITGKLFQHMSDIGYSFNESHMLSAGKSFSGNNGQARGIGAMGSDLVYTATFGQNQSAMDRMKNMINIANSLGIAEAFDQELLEKLASDDSTINKPVLLTKAYLNAKDQLFSEERAQLATFMVVGGWLEGLHVATEMVKTEIKDQEVQVGYWDIVHGMDNVIHMMEVFKNDSEMQSAIETMKLLQPSLNKINKNAKKYTVEDVQAVSEALKDVRGKLL